MKEIPIKEATTNISKGFQAFQEKAPQHAEAWVNAVKGLRAASTLDPKTAEIAFLAVMAAMRVNTGIPFHVKAAKRVGISREDVISAILTGLPLAGNGVIQALSIAIEAYDAE